MNKKLLFTILAVVFVVVVVVVAVFILCTSDNKKEADDTSDTTQEMITTEPEEETTEETTQPPETTAPETTVPDTTAPPPPAETTAADTPTLPAYTGEHKSANFGNVLFIGDSRTVGLKDYANLGAADVFAENGLNVFQLFKDVINIPGKGPVTLENLLSAKQYDKIYLMLGINEIGYNLDKVIAFYGRALDKIQGYQPNSTIYIQANLLIQKSRSDRDPVYNNTNMQYLNDHMAAFADGVKRIYIDVNPLFSDGAGNLSAQYAYDDFHLLGSYYAVWADWIYETTCE
ncbi:MAG: hypothetical protein KHW59_02530 [Clostridiales bacterium]|nr:hypothetical protein [Clostridiales bacterium]